MPKFIVWCEVKETIEVEADDEEQAIEIAQNASQEEFTYVDTDWTAVEGPGPDEG